MRYLSLIILAACMAASPTAPTTAPAASAHDINVLIAQLGHDDFSVREAAAKKLISIGKPALDAVKRAAENQDDPELRSRAKALAKRIVERPVPGGPVAKDEEIIARSLKISNEGGVRQINVREQARSIQIREGDFGIEMIVGAIENGEQVNAQFEAKNADDLKKQSPDAFTLYERWGGHAGQMNPMVRGAQNVVIRGPVFIGGMQGGAVFPVPLPPDPVDELRDRVVAEMQKRDIGEEDRKQVQLLLERLQQMRAARIVGQGAGDAQKQLKEQFEISDKLREKMAALKLEDPGEALPPPAKWRLGVQLAGDEGKVVVASVAPDSRADKIGLRPGDAIWKINGKEVAHVEGLKQNLQAAEGAITLIVVRDGKDVTLEEKK
jgi:hypothetical protein